MKKSAVQKSKMIDAGWQFHSTRIPVRNKAGIVFYKDAVTWSHPKLCPRPTSFTNALKIAFSPSLQTKLFPLNDSARLFISQ